VRHPVKFRVKKLIGCETSCETQREKINWVWDNLWNSGWKKLIGYETPCETQREKTNRVWDTLWNSGWKKLIGYETPCETQREKTNRGWDTLWNSWWLHRQLYCEQKKYKQLPPMPQKFVEKNLGFPPIILPLVGTCSLNMANLVSFFPS